MPDVKVMIKNKNDNYGYEESPRLKFNYEKTDKGLVFSIELKDVDMTFYNDISEIYVEKYNRTVATIKFD